MSDWVSILLTVDETPLEIPAELKECLLNEPEAMYKAFVKLSEGRQKTYID